MILSVSRRTDIPNYFSDWFLQRVKEGFLCVRNPFNPHQVSRISLSPDLIDCIIFWTKNPENMLERLNELNGYNYYFQFTLTGYGSDIEPGLTDKRKKLIPVFKQLSDKIGHDRVVWRYDPIFINERYTMDYHIKAFREIAESLNGYTDEAVISFMDIYPKMKKNSILYDMRVPDEKQMTGLAYEMAGEASKNHMIIRSCAEKIDLSSVGVMHGSCVDRDRIERIIGHQIKSGRDRNQREGCGCIESVDAGAYDTCQNGCKYCYAVRSEKTVSSRLLSYDVGSPLLCSVIGDGDKIKDINKV